MWNYQQRKLHHFQQHFQPFSLHKVADSNDFHSNTFFQAENEVYDLNFSQALKMIVKHEKQIPFVLSKKFADRWNFHSITSSQDPQNEVYDLKFCHTLEYDSKTKKNFFNFLHHFHKNPNSTFSDPPNKSNIVH